MIVVLYGYCRERSSHQDTLGLLKSPETESDARGIFRREGRTEESTNVGLIFILMIYLSNLLELKSCLVSERSEPVEEFYKLMIILEC